MESIDGEVLVLLWLCQPKHGVHSQSSPLGTLAIHGYTVGAIATHMEARHTLFENLWVCSARCLHRIFQYGYNVFQVSGHSIVVFVPILLLSALESSNAIY